MDATYEKDIIAWSKEQAALPRAGRLSALDLEHIADDVEDGGKGEQRELASRLAVLLAHLLKWCEQPERRGESWAFTIRQQRRALALHLDGIPSLRSTLRDPKWLEAVWADALAKAAEETGLASFRQPARRLNRSSSTPTFSPSDREAGSGTRHAARY